MKICLELLLVETGRGQKINQYIKVSWIDLQDLDNIVCTTPRLTASVLSSHLNNAHLTDDCLSSVHFLLIGVMRLVLFMMGAFKIL